MMLKIYLKQAWMLIRQNPLFSTLYIAGTGLAIAMTTIVAVIYYVKLAPVYPEENRWQTARLHSLGCSSEKRSWNSSYSYRALQDWALNLKHARLATAEYVGEMTLTCCIQPADRSGDFHPITKLVGPAFFRVYPLRFLEGSTFTEADLQSGIHKAVITDDLSRRLFGSVEGAVGRTFLMDYEEYRVCGVVSSGSYLTPDSYAQLYLPYSVCPGYDEPSTPLYPYIGQFCVTYLLADGSGVDDLNAELLDIQNRLNQEHKGEWEMNMHGGAVPQWMNGLQKWTSMNRFDLWPIVRTLGLTLLVLLLVPALNLMGMIASRMESRLAEMGVRKSFGAGRGKLLGQVMWENLLLTLLGGLLGLVVAWGMLYTGRSWLFSLFEEWPQAAPAGVNNYVSGEMLFAPAVFVSAFLLCVLLNLLSALLPAWLSLKKPIVHSLYERR